MESILGTFESQERQAPAKESAPTAATSPARKTTEKLGEQLVSLIDSESFEANEYRVLRHRIEETRANAGRGLIGVTSPGAGEGKTTTAINLAGTLAQSAGTRVLLIDADLRLPGVARHLGLRDAGAPGLTDLILDPRLTLERVVRQRAPTNLFILTSGRHLAAPYETLLSQRMGDLLEQARQTYDYVILDTPPVVPVPDLHAIARWVDRFIVVVAAHRTPRRYLEETLNALDPEKVAGLVFNSADPPQPGPYGYYTGYGMPAGR